MVRKLVYAVALLVLAASCTMQVQRSHFTVPYVDGILTDRTCYEYGLLASAAQFNPDASIVLVGSGEQCSHFSKALLECDVFDNVSGARSSDFLPDFSGETVVSIIDEVHTPYYGVYDVSKDSLRTIAAQLGVAAIDTVYAAGRYDLESRGRKLPAKMVILADESLTEYGKFDLDTLFYEVGCKVKVISPLQVMVNEALSGGRRGMNVMLICDSASVVSGISESVFKACAEHSDENRTAVSTAFYPLDDNWSLYDFLNDYLGDGNVAALDAILVDNPLVDVSKLRREYVHILDIDCVEHASYSNIIRPDFKIFESSECLCRNCYSILRTNNLFTHNIHYPKAFTMKTAEKPHSCKGGFMLISSTDVQN